MLNKELTDREKELLKTTATKELFYAIRAKLSVYAEYEKKVGVANNRTK